VADPESYLSPIARKALSQLEDLGVLGVDIENEPNTLFQKTYRELARMDLAVATETPWVYGRTGWAAMRAKVCGPGTLGREWRIAEVKDLLEVSRKPILGILNKLEEEGWLERKEDHRLVVKEAPAPTQS
jgi:ribosomal protein S19E (S16A)